MRLFAFIGSLLVLLLAAAFVVPPYVDWNRFKTRFEAEASQVLGQRVEVRGATTVRLLPLPSITFTDVRIGPVGSPLLSADAFSMDVEPAPLLRGDVTIVDMRLDAPHLRLALDMDGAIAWPGGAQQGVGTVAVENLSITDGSVRLSDPRTGGDIVIRRIEAKASASELRGPWRMEGTVAHSGERYRVSAGTGRWQPDDKSIRLRADVQPRSQPYDLSFDGPVTVGDEGTSLSGLLTIAPAAALDETEGTDFQRTFDSAPVPASFEADILLDADSLVSKAWTLAIGDGDDPYGLSGSATVTLGSDPRFDISAEGQQVDVERLSPDQGVGQTLDARLAMVRAALALLPKPPISGTLDLVLPAVVAGDTVVRDVALTVSPMLGLPEGTAGWRLKQSTATLPGRTTVQASGDLTLAQGDPAALNYEGRLTVASRQPSGLARWLGAEGDAGIRELSLAGFTAAATIGPGTLVLDDLEVQIDRDNLTGRIVAQGGRSLDASLRGDRVDLDRLSALARLLTGASALGLADQELTLTLDAGTAVLDGISAQKVSGTARYGPAGVAFDTVRIGNLAGLSLEADSSKDSVSVRFSGDDGRDAALLLSKRLGTVAELERLAQTPGALANPNITLSSAADDSLSVSGKIGGTNVDGFLATQGSWRELWRQGKTAIASGRLVLVNRRAASLLRQLGVPLGANVGPDASGRSAFRAAFTRSNTTTFDTEGAFAVAGGSFVDWSGPISFDERGRSFGTVKLRAQTSNLGAVAKLSGRRLPTAAQGVAADGTATMRFGTDAVVVDELEMNVGGVPVAGEITIDPHATPRPSVSGSLSADRMDAEIVLDFIFGEDRPLSGIDAEVSVALGRLDAAGTVARNIDGTARLTEGDLKFEVAQSRWLGGNAGGSVQLAQAGDTRLFSASGRIDDASLADVSHALRLPKGVTGSADLEVSLETSGRADGDPLNRLAGSGTLSVKRAKVPLIAEDAFANLLAAADETDDEALVASASALVGAAAKTADVEIEPTSLAFTINEGTIRVTDAPFLAPGSTGRLDARLDLAEQRFHTRAELTLDPGAERIEGATPQTTIETSGQLSGKAKRTVDTQSLETYLATRLAERRERTFQVQRAAILERQRLSRTVRLYALKAQAKAFAREELERLERERLERVERARREEDRRREEARRKLLEEAELRAAEARAAQEAERAAAAEAGRRAREQEAIDRIRKRNEARQRKVSREALERFDATGRTPVLNFDTPIIPDG